MNRIKLAIVSTHPIQYYAPVFRAMAREASVIPRVFFTWSQTAEGPVFDPGFGSRFSWDIPLLEGYDHQFVSNVAKRPGSNHFFGVQNPALSAVISDWGANAVLVYGWNLHSHLNVLRRFKGAIPVLFRGDSTLLDPRSPMRSRARKLFLRWVYAHVDMAIAVGQNNRDYYRWCGLREDQIAFAPHSVDTLRFGATDAEYTDRWVKWREDLGIPADAIVIVFAAKLTPKKDPLLLLDAYKALRSSAHLVFFGDGELEGVLRERARGENNVHFLPFQNQRSMPAVYRLGELFLIPSRGPGETWGLAMNEAMASGRPVIASSRVGGARDMIQEGVTGWVFEAGNKDELSRVLQTAIQSGRAHLLEMGDAAQKMSQLWSTEASAKAIATAVIRACASRSSAR
jgi:glycosyltransferase involved in cell wall biosynthesis